MAAMKKVAMKKTMKAMKKTVKPVMKKAMKKVSKVGRRSAVFNGKKEKTIGGLGKDGLKRNKNGKIVSKKASAAAKSRKGYAAIIKWSNCVKKARAELKIKGWCVVGGKTKEGQALLAKVKSMYYK